MNIRAIEYQRILTWVLDFAKLSSFVVHRIAKFGLLVQGWAVEDRPSLLIWLGFVHPVSELRQIVTEIFRIHAHRQRRLVNVAQATRSPHHTSHASKKVTGRGNNSYCGSATSQRREYLRTSH